MRLSTSNHDRDIADLTYVYPVVSRRAGGVSIGINLNPNNACNFRCIYCQVPNLIRGPAPAIDLELLQTELDTFLHTATQTDWLTTCVPEGAQVLKDIAFSGNGEPTSAEPLAEIFTLVANAATQHGLDLPHILITNGSHADTTRVQTALETLATHNGRAWFKLDAATDAGIAAINDWPGGIDATYENLKATAARIPTWIQTCVFATDNEPPTETETNAYLDLLERAREDDIPLRGVLLYGLARPSHQPEAPTLTRLPADWLEELSDSIRQIGLGCEAHH
jgi:wyosine [tRNA(Phe)-imidazoG37] synthetase (radical SAM superfamily)